ncbi:MAG: dUTP diphosphatase [Tepidisphaerales bacterium]
MSGWTGEVEVRIWRLPGQEDVPLPSRQTELAAGFDVHAAVAGPTPIPPGEVRLIPCGFAMALPPGWEAQIRPRSGLASRFAVGMPNSPGTIDADYRGELKIPLINWGREPFIVTRGMRVGQMVVKPVPPVRLTVVSTADELGSTARGEGGFGSTGH